MARILIVDDDELTAQLLTELLEEVGHHVVTAFSGQAALHRVLCHKPELIISDLRMPDMSGEELRRAVRELDGFANTGMILMTAAWVRDRPDPAYYAAVIEKPFEIQAVLDTVERAVQEPDGLRAQVRKPKPPVPSKAQRSNVQTF